MSANPVEQAIHLMERALKLLEDAELVMPALLRIEPTGAQWQELQGSAMKCADAMRAAAHMYGQPGPAPAKYALLKTDQKNQHTLVELTGQCGDWIRAVPISNRDSRELWLTLVDEAETGLMRRSAHIAYFLNQLDLPP